MPTLMWISFKKAYQHAKNRITGVFFCTVVSFMSLKLWSIAFLLPTICRCPACFCPAIIEYHRGSISTPSLSPSGLHDELWQLTDSLLSSSMNSFRVILCLLNAYCDQRWLGSGGVCAFMSRQAFVQSIIGEWTSTKVLQSYGRYNEPCFSNFTQREKSTNLVNLATLHVTRTKQRFVYCSTWLL